MIVLDGETSQWKRSAWPSLAIGPAVSSPAAIRSMASRCGRMDAGSRFGAKAASRLSSSAIRAPRKRAGRHNRTTPTLRDSPRSTRGRTRMIEYWNALRGGSGTFRLLDEGPWGFEPPGQIADVRPALRIGGADDRIVGQPRVRERGDQVGQCRLVDP